MFVQYSKSRLLIIIFFNYFSGLFAYVNLPVNKNNNVNSIIDNEHIKGENRGTKNELEWVYMDSITPHKVCNCITCKNILIKVFGIHLEKL
jgi:hypothetical protein